MESKMKEKHPDGSSSSCIPPGIYNPTSTLRQTKLCTCNSLVAYFTEKEEILELADKYNDPVFKLLKFTKKTARFYSYLGDSPPPPLFPVNKALWGGAWMTCRVNTHKII